MLYTVKLPEEMAMDMKSEDLGRYVSDHIAGVCQKLATIRPYVEELWFRFGRGEKILGCSTKKEFCERILHRAPVTIRHFLAEDVKESDKPVETISTIFESFSRKVRPLVPFCGDGMAHVFETMAEEVLVTPIRSEGDFETVNGIIYTLKVASTTFLDYANRLEQQLEKYNEVTIQPEKCDPPKRRIASA